MRAPAKPAFTEPWRKTATDTRKSPAGRKKSKSTAAVFNFTLSRLPCPTDLVARLCRCVRNKTYTNKTKAASARRALKHMRSAVKANHFTFLPLGRSGGAGSAAIDGFDDAAR